MHICALFPEILVDILKRLDGQDLGNVSQTCRTLCNALYHDDVWQSICRRDYRIASLDGWQARSFRELYTRVLYKYGYLLGLWRRELNPYGGLVHIRAGPGLVAEECCPPLNPDIQAPLQPQPLFSITLSGGDIELKCFRQEPAYSQCTIVKKSQENEDTVSSFYLTVNCENQESHKTATVCSGTLDSDDSEDDSDLLPNCRNANYGDPIHFSHLRLPANHADKELVLQPGIFKGTYGGHGIELIMATVSKERLVGTKITGDPNVPFGKVSFDVDLSRPVNEQDIPEQEGPEPGMQPFHLDQRYEAEYTGFPSTCRARYQGKGQIAYPGFFEPSWTPGQLIVFNEDLFGFLWTKLMSFSVYSRTTEPFLRHCWPASTFC